MAQIFKKLREKNWKYENDSSFAFILSKICKKNKENSYILHKLQLIFESFKAMLKPVKALTTQ